MRPEVQGIINVAKWYVSCDETEKAYWILDNPPAYLREPYDKNLLNFKNEILKNFSPPDQCKETDFEHGFHDIENQPMAQMILKWALIKTSTSEVIDVESQNRWVMEGLKELDVPLDSIDKNVFVSFGRIQNYSNEEEFLKQILNSEKEYKYLWLSVPRFMSEAPIPSYENKKITAYRGYTGQEFSNFCFRKLPQYSWEVIDGGRHIISFGTKR